MVRAVSGIVDGPFGRFGAGMRPQGVPVRATIVARSVVAASDARGREQRMLVGAAGASCPSGESSRAGPPEGPALGARSEWRKG
jgi:hypothetical protein